LEDEVGALIDLVEMQCGHRWSEHPTTARVLQLAINALLARYGAREGLKFALGELPDVRLEEIIAHRVEWRRFCAEGRNLEERQRYLSCIAGKFDAFRTFGQRVSVYNLALLEIDI
jgi:hypothetical protein